MTIAVVWQENDLLWCAADTRLVAGEEDTPTSELATKIYSIPLSIRAYDPHLDVYHAASEVRRPHYTTEYGFVYAGSALPASQTAITASTVLGNLAAPGGLSNPPRFEEIAAVVGRLAKRFIDDKRRLGADGKFSAAFFGWCPHESQYMVALINGREDYGPFRVEVSCEPCPGKDGQPWLILGSGTDTFNSTFGDYIKSAPPGGTLLPYRAIQRMITDEMDRAVGGAISLAAAHRYGFDMVCMTEPASFGQDGRSRIFNGLDLDRDVGQVGRYSVVASVIT